ncbi:MAG: hypothetical protein ACLRPT_11985 [Akkermansia muciniphila]
MTLDREDGVDFYANGSDVFAVVAEVTDGRGTVKRLNDEEIVFPWKVPPNF